MFKILMIDDETTYHALYKEIILTEFKAAMDFATDGVEALKILSKGKSYDLLILDLDMPRLDGISTLQQLRLNPIYKKVPILILTANSNDENQVRLLNLGANDFIAKGCTPEVFLGRLKNLVAYKEFFDSFRNDKLHFEKFLQTAMTEIELVLEYITENFFTNYHCTTKHSESTDNPDKIAKWLIKFEQFISRVIDKTTEPEKYLSIATHDITSLWMDFQTESHPFFNRVKYFMFDIRPGTNLKTDKDILFFLLMSISASGQPTTLFNKNTQDCEKDGSLLALKGEVDISPDRMLHLQQLANIANLTLTTHKDYIVIKPSNNS